MAIKKILFLLKSFYKQTIEIYSAIVLYLHILVDLTTNEIKPLIYF